MLVHHSIWSGKQRGKWAVGVYGSQGEGGGAWGQSPVVVWAGDPRQGEGVKDVDGKRGQQRRRLDAPLGRGLGRCRSDEGKTRAECEPHAPLGEKIKFQKDFLGGPGGGGSVKINVWGETLVRLT